MILPTESSHDVAGWRRQLLLDLGTPSLTPGAAATGAVGAGAGAAAGGGGGGAAKGSITSASAITPSTGPLALAPAQAVPTPAAPAPAAVAPLPPPAVAEPPESTIFVTTRRPSSSTPTAAVEPELEPDPTLGGGTAEPVETGNILSRAVANSNLSWWQLICVAIAGALVIAVGVWAVFRAVGSGSGSGGGAGGGKWADRMRARRG